VSLSRCLVRPARNNPPPLVDVGPGRGGSEARCSWCHVSVNEADRRAVSEAASDSEAMRGTDNAAPNNNESSTSAGV
jgi:hypothetical protein